MKQSKFIAFMMATAAVAAFAACNNQSAAPTATGTEERTTPLAVYGEEVSYKDDTTELHGFVAYDSGTTKKRPGIIVVPEWWGMTDYPKSRAKQLAALGYIAIAADIYGNGKVADNPKDAGAWAGTFYKDPLLAKSRIEAAINKLKSYPQLDTANIAGIGYCFGGGILLNTVRLGEPLKAVVSFHGSLVGTPADKNLLKAKILVCQGEADQFVKPEERALFKKQMDSIGADYTFKSYPGAMHAFTNPAATATGEKFKLPIAYNAAADSASWKDMKDFFEKTLQ